MANFFRLLMVLAAATSRSRRREAKLVASQAGLDSTRNSSARLAEPSISSKRKEIHDRAAKMIENGKIGHIINEIIERQSDVNVFDVAVILSIAIQIRPELDLKKVSILVELEMIDGLDSLDSIIFIDEIETYFGIYIPNEIFESDLNGNRGVKTVEDLARALLKARYF